MDISQQYIQMCRQAKEIQDLCRGKHQGIISPEEVDTIPNLFSTVVGELEASERTVEFDPKHEVWLPRQDQLQSILFATLKKVSADTNLQLKLLFDQQKGLIGVDWDDKRSDMGQTIPVTSLEQFFLIATMWYVYRKMWNGTEWIS